ncbi:g3248 [Coccomyxa viridis]|uniref:G3248 protein n=1 Tax=Coccomyxa viridis TaxID=1274662 RepID=A0ABP1FPM1_9CHLO
MDAVNDERTLKDIESYERFQKKLQDQIEQGLSKCTKLLEEREFDLQELVDNFFTRGFPSGLTLELEEWVSNLIAADIMEARLERMRALLQTRENKYGKLSCRLQDQVIRLLVPAGAADAPVMYPMSCASQSASRPTGGAHARLYGADIEEEVSMPLLPKPTRTVVSEEEENEMTPLLHRLSSYNCTSSCHSEVERQSVGAGAGGSHWGALLVW